MGGRFEGSSRGGVGSGIVRAGMIWGRGGRGGRGAGRGEEERSGICVA